MDKQVLSKRADRIKEIMDEKDLDVVVAASPENVFYTTGTYITTMKTIRSRLVFSIIPKVGDAVFVACGIDESLVRYTTWIDDIRPYIEFQQSPVKFLADALVEKGLEKKKVGIELGYLNSTAYEELLGYLPNTKFCECNEVFDIARMIKAPQEIELLTRAAVASRKAVNAAFIMAKPGDTERQLATSIMTNLLGQGLDAGFMMLGAGEKTLLAHPVADDIPIKEGDLVRVDFGGVLDGYISDLGRTVAVGKPSATQSEAYKKMLDIQKELIEGMKIGVRICDVFHKCAKLFEEKGLPFDMPHIGHGLGLDLHEQPLISPLNEEVIQENMVICVEPFFYYNGYGYHEEDLVLITADGPKILTELELCNEIPVITY